MIDNDYEEVEAVRRREYKNDFKFDDYRKNKRDFKEVRRERRQNKARNWLIDPDD